MLTKKQAELLAYIETYMAIEKVSPSFEEMKQALRIKSKSGVHRLITALEERGHISRIPNRARCLTVSTAGLSNFSDAQLVACLESRGYRVSAIRRKTELGVPEALAAHG